MSPSLPSSAAARRTGKRSLPRKQQPTTLLAPVAARQPSPLLSPGKRNQLDSERSNPQGRVPLEAIFINRYRRWLRIEITFTGLDPADADLRTLVSGNGGAVESLVLDECPHVTVDGFRAALPVLQQLTVLRLKRCSGMGLGLVDLLPRSLVELDLSYCEWLDDHGVRFFARHCLALRHVTLTHCRRLTDYGVSAFTDSNTAIVSIDISLLPRVTDTGVLALLLRCPKLHSFSATSLSSLEGFNLHSLPRNTAPALKKFDLSKNVRMHSATVAHVLRSFRPGVLVEIDICYCSQLNDETLEAIGEYAPSLRVLRAAFCTQFTDNGIVALVMKRVRSEEYDDSSLQNDDADNDEDIQPRCRQIRILDLTGCFLITSVGIKAIARCSSELSTLLIDGLRRVDAIAIRALSSHCLQLHTIHWGGILIHAGGPADNETPQQKGGFFSVPQVDRLAATVLPLSLRCLRLGHSQCDVDALAQTLARIGSQLTELDATGITTDTLCLAIATHCRQLHTLRLRRSRYFSEASFLEVAAHCTQLKVLDLESCEQLQDRTLRALGKHSGGSTLEHLALSNDWQITDAGISFLVPRCSSLRRLQVRHCPEISPQCLRELARHHSLVIATADGLEPKPTTVLACLRLESELHSAARRIGRWFKDCSAGHAHSQSAIDRALRHIRKRRRCAVTIQRCIRRWLAHCRQLKIVADAKASRDRQREQHWAWVIAYCVLCRLLRSQLRKWVVARHEELFRREERLQQCRIAAATHTQRFYRGWKGRERAALVRRRREELHRRRIACAIVIQRVWRGCTARDAVAHIRIKAFKLLLSKAYEMSKAEAAAMHIARVGRGYIGRKRANKRREEVVAQRERQQTSALKIQRCTRAFFARVSFGRLLARGATAMQRVVRGFFGRRIARQFIVEKAYAHVPRLLLFSRHSIYNQALAIRWKTKHDAGERIALVMQCFYRGYYLGRLPRSRLRAAARQRSYHLDLNARQLQHFFRGIVIIHRLARLKAILKLRKLSATKIQSVWRMWEGKVIATAAALRRDRQRRHAATLQTLSTADTPAQLRRQLLQLGAIHVLATMYRNSLRLRGWRAPSFVRFIQRCASQIQSLVRGHQTRKYVAWYRQRMTTATRMVQRVWRGKLGRKQWRVMIMERRQQQRLQEELDRAGRVAQMRTGQYVLDAGARQEHHVKLLQQWVRTLQHRQVFKQSKMVRDAAIRSRASDKLKTILTMSHESVVFQARVWRECMDNKQKLNEMEDSDVRALETDIAALKRQCLDEYVAHAEASAQYAELSKAKRGCAVAKKKLRDDTASMKATIHPFAEQAKRLTMESARVHVTNRQLQDELRRVKQSVVTFQQQLQGVLPLVREPDIQRLVQLLGLPNGKRSLVEEELQASVSS